MPDSDWHDLLACATFDDDAIDVVRRSEHATHASGATLSTSGDSGWSSARRSERISHGASTARRERAMTWRPNSARRGSASCATTSRWQSRTEKFVLRATPGHLGPAVDDGPSAES